MADSAASTPTAPVYAKLKDLHIRTELVKGGRPGVTIVTPAGGLYDAQASRIQEAIERRTGVKVPVAKDDAPEATVPIRGNLIVLGNRSTNRTIEELYNRYFTLLDLWYPGAGGYEVRSLHNPFGGGHNVIFAGGSDAAGVDRAADALAEKIGQAEGERGSLWVGWLMEVQLGRGMAPQKDLKAFEIWDANAGRGSVGYFGWNSLSKRMAMYYVTGDEFHAREALRLAFPDERAKREITEIDGELVENKDDPLSGPYHYGAHQMILFWDLIEESPAFSDEERLRVTNAFSKQFAHPQEWGWRRTLYENVQKGVRPYDEPPPRVGTRHGKWSAVVLYLLGRYFQRDYGDPLWQHCLDWAMWYFSPLHRHAWMDSEDDIYPWYCTGLEPVLTYMLLTGDRKLLENGVLRTFLLGQEVMLSGREPDGAISQASIGCLRKAAYVMQDGRWLEYLRRTGIDLGVFRLGQSFAPEAHLRPALPTDLVGRWSFLPMPEPMWRSRANGLPLKECFQFGSFRSAPDASGDYALIKGWNGAWRNPYHAFVILELRIDGQTVLEGFLNQVLARADGMVEPKVAMEGAMRHQDVIGGTAVAVGEVPDAAFCSWRRTLVQRVGRYVLFVDRLKFRGDTGDMEAEVLWQGKGAWRALPEGGAVRVETERPFEIRLSDPLETTVEEGRAKMVWRGAVRDGEEKIFFSLLAEERGAPLTCARLAENAAALSLPGPAVAVSGEFEGLCGEFVLLARDHLHGIGLTRAGLGAMLLSADAPVGVDWDFEEGKLHVVTVRDTKVEVALEEGDPSIRPFGATRDKRIAVSPSSGQRPRIEGKAEGEGTQDSGLRTQGGGGGQGTFVLPPGRHCIEGARPDPQALQRVRERLEMLLGQGRERRQVAHGAGAPAWPAVPGLSTVFTADIGGRAVELLPISSKDGIRICVVEGERVHALTQEGRALRTLRADGLIRALRWWEEHGLLLAGCVDDRVIAFDLSTGERRWVFASQEDPEVFRAAKPYWFRTAPGHEGVHGVHTGVFLDGKSQAFVGSACTLEIIDENGALVRRMPVFWGAGSRFALVDGPEGSVNLLVARHPTEVHTVAVINNRTLDPRPRSFHGVPPGQTYIPGWQSMSRRHLFYEDVDGDGRREVISEVNGSWNRASVWAEDGTPLHNVNLGPGERHPALNVRDLDLADLDGDGKKEILVATSGGRVMALDCQCQKAWVRRLPSPPTVLTCVCTDGRPWVAVGCEDGSLVALDGKGEVFGRSSVRGRPTCIGVMDGVAVVGTDAGEVKGWTVERS